MTVRAEDFVRRVYTDFLQPGHFQLGTELHKNSSFLDFCTGKTGPEFFTTLTKLTPCVLITMADPGPRAHNLNRD